MKSKSCNNKKSLNEISQVAEFLKIISEENRLKILCLLKGEEEMCVCDIWHYLNLSQNLTSHHLGALKDFDLVSSRKEGAKVFYSINSKVVNKYHSLLKRYINN